MISRHDPLIHHLQEFRDLEPVACSQVPELKHVTNLSTSETVFYSGSRSLLIRIKKLSKDTYQAFLRC